MPIEIAVNKPTSVKSPKPPKKEANELAAFTEYMIRVMSERFRNQAIKALNAGTVEKFADAQTGNYAKIFLNLAGSVTSKMIAQFGDYRIEEMVSKVLGKVDKRARDEFYSRIENTIGISSKELAATEAMKSTTEALMLETSQWVKKLRDETMELYTSNTLRAMTLGTGLEGVLDEFDQMEEKRKGHAKFTARNQINTYNSVSTKIRAQNLGIEKGKWVTAHDERVRPSHKDRDGKEFDLAEGLYSPIDGKHLLPGTDFNCRCTYLLILPEE